MRMHTIWPKDCWHLICTPIWRPQNCFCFKMILLIRCHHHFPFVPSVNSLLRNVSKHEITSSLRLIMLSLQNLIKHNPCLWLTNKTLVIVLQCRAGACLRMRTTEPLKEEKQLFGSGTTSGNNIVRWARLHVKIVYTLHFLCGYILTRLEFW